MGKSEEQCWMVKPGLLPMCVTEYGLRGCPWLSGLQIITGLFFYGFGIMPASIAIWII